MYRKSKSTTKLKFFLHISLKKKERKCIKRKQRRKNPKGNRKFYVKVFFYLSALAFYYYYDNFSVLCLFFGPEKKIKVLYIFVCLIARILGSFFMEMLSIFIFSFDNWCQVSIFWSILLAGDFFLAFQPFFALK